MASNFAPTVATHYLPDRIRYFPVTAGQTFIAGALVLLTAGAVSETGADPTSILGIALAPASMGLDTRGSIFGGTNIPVFVLTPNDTIFMGSSTTPVFATHVGTAYGVVKSTNWLVDTTEVATPCLVVIGVSNTPQQEGYYVRFTADRLQLDAIAS